MRSDSQVIPRLVAMALLATVLVAAVSCGDKGMGVVTGKVTVDGKPVTHGSITFLSEVGNKDPFTAGIIEGDYTTPPIPVGATKIYIVSREVPPGGPEGGGNDLQKSAPKGSPKVIKVPDKYGSPDTSGLTYDVVKGDQTKNFELSN